MIMQHGGALESTLDKRVRLACAGSLVEPASTTGRTTFLPAANMPGKRRLFGTLFCFHSL